VLTRVETEFIVPVESWWTSPVWVFSESDVVNGRLQSSVNEAPFQQQLSY